MIEIFSTIEEFGTLRGSWDSLFAQSEYVTPYQSYTFCHSSLPLLSGDLHIIGWSRKNMLQAIFPLYIDSSGTLRFINDRHADFCSPIVTKEAKGDFHMCEEIAEHIRKTKKIKRVRLENMRYDLFQTSLQFQLKGSLLYTYARYSYFTVPEAGTAKTAIDSLDHLSRKEKYRLKNISSKMEKAETQWKSFDASYSDAWPGALIHELTDSMVDAGIRKRKYFSQEYLDFVKNVYESGNLMISATYLDECPASCNLYLKHGKEYIDWMAFYSAPSNNAWNLLQFLSWLHTNGGGVLNFARGIYMYKLHNYRPAIGSLDRLHFSKSTFGKCGDIFRCLVSEIKRMIRGR